MKLAMLDGFAKEKLEKCLKKNSDLEWIRNPYIGDTIDLDTKRILRYLPLVTVDVERSFSLYKNLLTDKRWLFSKENIVKMLFMQCNACIINDISVSLQHFIPVTITLTCRHNLSPKYNILSPLY